MNQDTTSHYWLDLAIEEILKRYPEGTIIVSSGISPSANYHIGHFREILTAEAIAWGLRRNGRTAQHIHVVDNFDPLRKRYDFLPEWLEEFVGQPICLVPSPDKTQDISYADYFFNAFLESAERMGIAPSKIIKSYEDLYLTGRMTSAIEDSLERIDEVKAIFAEVSNRRLEGDWTPLQVLNDSNHFEQGNSEGWDKQTQTINGVSYTSGRVKLNWRLDWPARWRELGVQVEPFSYQEHGASGGSYDTGVAISKRVFHNEPPIPGAQYGNIHLVGDTKKMSSSKGNLVTPAEALEIMPPEILRYFAVRSRPEKTLYFDPALGLYQLIDEYSKVEASMAKGEPSPWGDAFEFASAESDKASATITTIPFNHLVTCFQTARGDRELIRELLARTGFAEEVSEQSAALERELRYVENWLSRHAPAEVKFTLSDSLPDIEPSETEVRFLTKLSDAFAECDWQAEAIAQVIFETAKQTELAPRTAFMLLYRLFLKQDSGPKLGVFLSTLERKFVVNRVRRDS